MLKISLLVFLGLVLGFQMGSVYQLKKDIKTVEKYEALSEKSIKVMDRCVDVAGKMKTEIESLRKQLKHKR